MEKNRKLRKLNLSRETVRVIEISSLDEAKGAVVTQFCSFPTINFNNTVCRCH